MRLKYSNGLLIASVVLLASVALAGAVILDGDAFVDDLDNGADVSFNSANSIPGTMITVTAGTGGSISPSSTVVNYGGSQTFTITASQGYVISDVKVDGSSLGAVSTYTFSHVYESHTISATFSALEYTITVTAGTGGSISPSSATVDYGQYQTFNITASYMYEITDVLVDGSSVGAVSTYTFYDVDANHTISATFSIQKFTITTDAGTGGSISPSSATVDYGGSQTFNITASYGYEIADVIVDGSSVGAVSTYTFSNVYYNHTISATFSESQSGYTITATAGTGGSISPSSATVDYGESQTFTITASKGYKISDVKVDGASVGAVSTYTFSYVHDDHTISATFYALSNPKCDITATAGTGGSISPSSQVNYGGDSTFYISAWTGQKIADVKVDGASVGAVLTYTFYDVTEDHTISVTFSIQQFTITVDAGPGGSISPSSVTVNYGESQTFTIIPASGYSLSGVSIDKNTILNNLSQYTFENVTSNHTISVMFVAISESDPPKTYNFWEMLVFFILLIMIIVIFFLYYFFKKSKAV